MRKAIFLALAIGIIFAFVAAPVSAQTWEGKMDGDGYTNTSTNLNQWQYFSGGCGDSCKGINAMKMSSGQSGEAGLWLSGKEKKVDLVTGSGEFKYYTGYNQENYSPNGFQKSWGEQSGKVTGFIKSH